jgi:type IV pilus assembly protein PilW
MKNLGNITIKKRQRGMGLVELMISLVISLVLLGALTYFYLSSQRMNRAHDDVSRMQESGRNAMEILGKAIRQAGSRLDLNANQDWPASCGFPPNTKSKLYVNPANCIDAIIGTNGDGANDVLGSTALADTITIRHDPTSTPTATDALAGKDTDCEGVTKTSSSPSFTDPSGMRDPNTQVVEYAFSISVIPGNSTRTLRCNNTASNPATGGTIIVDNIENMQITYGIRDATGSITSYKAQPIPAEFADVAAVKVSLLIRGPSANVTANKSQKYFYNGAETTATDGFLRHVYTSTFAVRNQAF